MESRRFNELERRAADVAGLDVIRNLESRARVHSVVEEMKAEGNAFELSEEEERMLQSFRRFRLRMRKVCETFTWQTRRPDGVQLAADTAEVVLPSEV